MEIMYFILGMVAAAALVVGVVIFNVRVKINKLGEEVTQLNEGLRDAFHQTTRTWTGQAVVFS